MNHQLRPAATFVGALLILALVTVACGRAGGPGADATGTAATDVAPATEASPTLDAATIDATPDARESASPAPIYNPGSALDAVDSDIQALSRFLSGLDSSLAGSDVGAGGGE